MTGKRALILASRSPARAMLLRDAGLTFTQVPVGVDERGPMPGESMETLVEELAILKARAAAREHPGTVVITADTLVRCGDEILGKPEDRADARRMLIRFHTDNQVISTGQAVACEVDGQLHLIHGVATSVVESNLLDDVAIETYLDTGAWENCSGAYGVESDDDDYISLVSGDLDTVIGISIPLLQEQLEKLQAKL